MNIVVISLFAFFIAHICEYHGWGFVREDAVSKPILSSVSLKYLTTNTRELILWHSDKPGTVRYSLRAVLVALDVRTDS